MDLASTIRAAAAQYGVDPGVMLKIAQVESGMNPAARNPKSSAGGLFQFIDGTAGQYGLADRFDPVAASDAAARLTRDNTATLRRGLGREPTPGEIYLAHQQGAGGALKMLQNPSAPVGGAAIALNGGAPGMTGGDFAQKWVGKFDGGGPSAGQGAASGSVYGSAQPPAQVGPMIGQNEPGIDLSPLAEVMQRVASQQPARQKRKGGPLVLS
jgi:hypothetical protein